MERRWHEPLTSPLFSCIHIHSCHTSRSSSKQQESNRKDVLQRQPERLLLRQLRYISSPETFRTTIPQSNLCFIQTAKVAAGTATTTKRRPTAGAATTTPRLPTAGTATTPPTPRQVDTVQYVYITKPLPTYLHWLAKHLLISS